MSETYPMQGTRESSLNQTPPVTWSLRTREATRVGAAQEASRGNSTKA